MTEQEAEALAKRLERIWRTDHDRERLWCWELSDNDTFRMQEVIESEIHFDYHSFDRGQTRSEVYRLTLTHDGKVVAYLIHRYDWPTAREHDPTLGHNGKIKEFFVQWMPFFLRNCWLSGCPIEASAHEKAEWILGFTREELESWNLMM